MANRWGNNRNNKRLYFGGALKSLQMVTAAMKLKDACSLGENLWPTAAAAVSLQLCPTLCDPIDGSPQGSAVPGILQARTLEWVAISFSNAWKWKVKVKSLSRVWLFVTQWTAAHQAPPSMGVSRQEYWSGVPLPSPILKLAIVNCSYLQNWWLTATKE